MKFRYAHYEIDPSPTVPTGILCRPEIPVDVIGPRNVETVQALIDSGSDETVFPASLADAIGVQLQWDATGQAAAVGGHVVNLIPGSVILEIALGEEKYRWRTTVQFLQVEDPEQEVALLGYAGFLEFFRATLDSETRELELIPNSRFTEAN
jgi:hypothetical protein